MAAWHARTVRLIAIALVVIFGPGLAQWVSLSWRQHLMDRRLRELEARSQALTTEHDRLTSDPAYVEGKIRSTFKVAKPNELVVPLESEPSRDP